MYTYTENEFIIIKHRNRQTLCKASVVLAGTDGSVLPDMEPEPTGLVMGVVAGLAFGVRGAANFAPPPPRAKFVFQNLLYYRVECEKLFCKTNIKLKELKLNKTE